MDKYTPTHAEIRAALMSPGPNGRNECCHFCGHDFRAFEFYAMGWQQEKLQRACNNCSGKLERTVSLCQHRPAPHRISSQVGRA